MKQTENERIREQKIDNMRTEFFSFGLHYYIAARYCFFAQLNPVSANQFHHAVEMLLKGFLYTTLSRENQQQEPEETSKKLKNRFGHNLPKMWGAFKSKFSDSTLNQFDSVINGLHKFESIRYPDELAFKGGIIRTGIEDTDLSQGENPTARPEPEYQFALVPLDKLVNVIFEKSRINPPFFTGSLNQRAATYLLHENEVPYETRGFPAQDD